MPASQFVVPSTYVELRKAVEAVVFKGRAEIDRAWLHTYHETGRLINEHVLRNKDRADYGAKVYPRLAEDTGISKRTLQQCAQFQRCFPIAPARAQLTWIHYRTLCEVADAGERASLLRQTLKSGWNSRQLDEQVRAVNARCRIEAEPGAVTPANATLALLTPKRGTAGVCKVVAVGAALVVDLGFATYYDLPEGSGLAVGALVRLDASGRATPVEGAGKADLFTYTAEILKVVDGDTLWVKIYLRPGQWVKQKLRLRDLDCPEIATPEGKVAKRFTDSLVPAGTTVSICTTKPDKYDRYLADVFVEVTSDEGPVTSAAPEVFLNNALLEAGHAVVKRAWEFGDWGEA